MGVTQSHPCQCDYYGLQGQHSGLHKYLYANANPIMGRDPSGRFELAEILTASTIVGTLSIIAVPSAIGIYGAVTGNWPDALGFGIYASGSVTPGVGFFGGIEAVFFPREKRLLLYGFGAYEGFPGSGESLGDRWKKTWELHPHWELGMFTAWYWNSKPEAGWNPFGLVGGQIPTIGGSGIFGALEFDNTGPHAVLTGGYFESSEAGMQVFGAGGAAYTIDDISVDKGDMIAAAATMMAGMSTAELAVSRVNANLASAAIGSGINAGIAAAWVNATYGKGKP